MSLRHTAIAACIAVSGVMAALALPAKAAPVQGQPGVDYQIVPVQAQPYWQNRHRSMGSVNRPWVGSHAGPWNGIHNRPVITTRNGVFRSVHNGPMNGGQLQAHRTWDPARDGGRCRQWGSHCRHFHDGYYYANPWWLIPPLVGGVIMSEDYGDPYYYDEPSYDDDSGYDDNAHVQWCLDHYRSYNPSTDTWVAYSGEVRRCVSPY